MSPFLDALKGQNRCGRAPVWFMRQAGRALSSYRKLREKHSLSALFHDSDLAAEVTLLPEKDLGVDALILFSDILVITEAMGLTLYYPEGSSPYTSSLGSERIIRPPAEVLSYVRHTIEKVKARTQLPLIGFCGGPYTVAHYLKVPITEALLDEITSLSIDYLKMQVRAGVDAIQIFDSWANLLSTEEFRKVCLPTLRKILEAMRPLHVPIILFCRGSCQWAEDLVSLSPAAISFDWQMPIETLRTIVPRTITVQGNLDPSLLLQEGFEEPARGLLTSMKGDSGFIFNLGHGVLPNTPEAHLKRLVDLVKEGI